MARSWLEPTSWLSPRNALNMGFNNAQQWAEEEVRRRAQAAAAWTERNVVRPAAKAFDGAMTNVGQGQMYQGRAYRDMAAARPPRTVAHPNSQGSHPDTSGRRSSPSSSATPPPRRTQSSASDVFGNLSQGREVLTGGIKTALAATGGSKEVIDAADNTFGAAGTLFDLLSEGYKMRDEVTAGRDPDVAAVRSSARMGAVGLGEALGRWAGGQAGIALGGGAGALEGGVGALPGAAIGGVAGQAAGGLLGGYLTEQSPLDDWAADGAERIYLPARRAVKGVLGWR